MRTEQSPAAVERIRYRDRESGEIREERVFAEGSLRRLYGQGWERGLTDRVLTHPAVSAAYGLWQSAPWTKRKIASFAQSLGIDTSEAELPVEDYPSLNAFFARRLAAGARPIDPDPARLASPCDGRLLAYPRLGGDRLSIKGSQVSLPVLLGSEQTARAYRGGDVLVFRLAPADYHRFHFPDAGTASPAKRLGRWLHSVHPIALAGGAPAFENLRYVSTLASERFGEILLVEVGALLVGRVAQDYAPGPVTRGQEKGYFEFGGSTVVLVTPPGAAAIDRDLCDATREGLETFVKMGTGIASATT